MYLSEVFLTFYVGIKLVHGMCMFVKSSKTKVIEVMFMVVMKTAFINNNVFKKRFLLHQEKLCDGFLKWAFWSFSWGGREEIN